MRPRRPLAARLAASYRVDPETGCWLWTGKLKPSGYAEIASGGGSRSAHRVSYEIHVGLILEGLVLDHLCRVRHCVNPAHLEPVTQRENILRGEGRAAETAAKTTCPAGHTYDDENTSIVCGRRVCRACARAKAKRYRARKRAAA